MKEVSEGEKLKKRVGLFVEPAGNPRRETQGYFLTRRGIYIPRGRGKVTS
jgi:hypothetical protein